MPRTRTPKTDPEVSRLLTSSSPPTLKEWDKLTDDQKREYNQRVHGGISTTYRVIRLPYVPSAVRNLPFHLYPRR